MERRRWIGLRFPVIAIEMSSFVFEKGIQAVRSWSTLKSLAMHVVLFTIALTSLLAQPVVAQPKQLDLKGVYPPSGQIGTEIELTLRSAPPTWPLQVWSDRAGLEIQCQSEKGKLLAKIAPEATPGTYWLRFYDGGGASALMPFYVEACEQQLEAEPNDRPEQGQSVTVPMAIVGRLEKRGDVDGFQINLKAHQHLTAALFARRPVGSPMDAVMQICDRHGRVFDQNDDERGIDPQLSFIAPADGVYLVRLFAFPETANSTIAYAGEEAFIYRLELSSDVRFEAEQLAEAHADSSSRLSCVVHENRNSMTLYSPNQIGSLEIAGMQLDQLLLTKVVGNTIDEARQFNDPSHPLPIAISSIRADDERTLEMKELPLEGWGTIDDASEWDTYRIAMKKNDQVEIMVEAREILQQLDPLVIVIDKSGQEVGRQDDLDRNNRDVDWVYKAPEDGVYEIRIGDATSRNGARFAYRCRLQHVEPRYKLTVAADRMLTTVNQKASLEVTVIREHGHVEPITVSAESLPPGVTVTPAVSEMKSDTEKKVTLEFEATQPVVGQPFQVVGMDAQERRALATFALPQDLRDHTSLWIGVGQAPAAPPNQVP